MINYEKLRQVMPVEVFLEMYPPLVAHQAIPALIRLLGEWTEEERLLFKREFDKMMETLSE